MTLKSVRPEVALFPRRRNDDGGDASTRNWLVSFTEMLAILLSFFVMLYATRDPSAPQFERFAVEPIAPIVAQTPVQERKAEVMLAKPQPGLDLNYIAALLRQAVERDPVFAGLMIVQNEYSLAVRLARPDQLAPLLDRMEAYRRTIAVFGPEEALLPLYGNKRAGALRLFPMDRHKIPLILIY